MGQPVGPGRPGWHVECSAMSMKYLGPSFDLHTGGIDNMFPHHEDEIAQSEAANGCDYVKYWMHCAHLMVDGEKMSKSLGNFYTLRDLLGKGYSGREIRWTLLGAHYRKKLNFTMESLDFARENQRRFDDFILRVRQAGGNDLPELDMALARGEAGFKAGLGDDLNISEALAALFGMEREVNKLLEAGSLGQAGAERVLAAFRRCDAVLGCLNVDAAAGMEFPPEIVALAEARQAARKARDFARSDACRDQLKAAGYVVEDTASGYRIKPLQES